MSPESRYSRQIRFAPMGDDGQRRIRAAGVAIVGCGALGSLQAEILARAGVGRLRLIDRDFVEWSNLQRQFLFDEQDAAEATPKAVAAARRLARVNSDVALEPMVADLTAPNATELFDGIEVRNDRGAAVHVLLYVDSVHHEAVGRFALSVDGQIAGI